MPDYKQAVFISYVLGHGRTAVFIEPSGDVKYMDQPFPRSSSHKL